MSRKMDVVVGLRFFRSKTNFCSTSGRKTKRFYETIWKHLEFFLFVILIVKE